LFKLLYNFLINIIIVVLFKYYIFENIQFFNFAINNKEKYANLFLQF